MNLLCLLFYVGSALAGIFLGWSLFGGNKKRTDQLQLQSSQDRMALNEAIQEFNKFKTEAKSQITRRDTEISKLKKSSALPDIITKAQEKEINHWKSKANDLEHKLSTSAPDKASKKLKEELRLSLESLESKNSKITELKSKLETAKNSSEQPDLSEEYAELSHQVNKLKKKIKAQKKELGQIKTVVIKETLDIDKLSKLLSQGKLTTKTKKVSKKKIKKSKSNS